MRSRQLLNIGLAVLVAALATLMIIEPGQKQTPPPQLLSSLQATDIQHITITDSAQKTIRFQKQNNHWQITTPFIAPANHARIEQLLEIVSAKSHAQYSISGLDLPQLGLFPAKYQLQLDDLLLHFGTTDSLYQRRYVQIADVVHLMTDRFIHLLQGSATDFVDSQLIPENNLITKLTLPDFQLDKDNTHWQVTGLDPQPAADTIQQLLDEWASARALRISRATEALAEPNILIQFTGEEKIFKLIMSRSPDEILFTRPDLRLNYHFPISRGDRLLNLAPPPENKKE